MRVIILSVLMMLVCGSAYSEIKAFPNKIEVDNFRGQIKVTSTYYNDFNGNDVVDKGELIINDGTTRYSYSQFETKQEHLDLIQYDLNEHCRSLLIKENQEYVINQIIYIDEELVNKYETLLAEDFTGKTIDRVIDGLNVSAVLNYIVGFKEGNQVGLYFDIAFTIDGQLVPIADTPMHKSLFAFRVSQEDTKESKLLEVRTRVLNHMEMLAKNFLKANELKDDVLKIKASVKTTEIQYQGRVINVSIDSKFNSVVDAVSIK